MPILPYLEHTPRLEGDVFLAPTAYVVGNVTIGAGSGVWFGCTVRGDTEAVTIGRCVNIQEGATVHTGPSHPVVIGDNVTIGHQAVVHGAVIADDVLIGIGASVLNGARVGRGSIIAAHALVPEGREIPPGSLVVGVPGRVLRPVTPAERDRIRRTAETYARLARQYRSSWELGAAASAAGRLAAEQPAEQA